MAGRDVTTFRLRPAAQDDLEAIWRTTAHTWSANQADAYIRKLISAFELLVALPEIAPERPELSGGIRVKAVEAHVILYRIGDDHIDVVRIRHAREDWIGDPEG